MHACNHEASLQSNSVGVLDPEQTPANQQGAFSLLHAMAQGEETSSRLWSWGRWHAKMEVQAWEALRRSGAGTKHKRRPYLPELSTSLELSGMTASIHLCHIYSIGTDFPGLIKGSSPLLGLQVLLLLHFCIFYAINCFCPVLNPNNSLLLWHRKRSSASRCVTDHMSVRDESGLDSIRRSDDWVQP